MHLTAGFLPRNAGWLAIGLTLAVVAVLGPPAERSKCSGLHSSAEWLALIGLIRLTLAGIIGRVWLTLCGFLATLDTAGEFGVGRLFTASLAP